MWNLIKSAASASIPSWVSVAAVLAAVGGYTAWVMYRQHSIDQVSYNKLAEVHKNFVEQVRGLGQAARAANEKAAAEYRARLEKMESDHANREGKIKAEASASDQRNSGVVASLRLQLAAARAGSGGGPGAGGSSAAQGADRLECYDAPELEQRVRGSLGRFLARASGVVRRGEEAESLVQLCRDYAAGFAPISPPLK